jgi:hypothetical protein
MGVRADEEQRGGDAVLAVEVQEIRDAHRASVREVAGRWEQGLRGLLGLVGITGVVGAPLATERLTGPTQVAVGLLLCVVLVAAATGLVLTMSAAYGSVQLVPPPRSRTGLQRLRWSLAERDRHRCLWGRRCAVGALLLFAVSVAVAWLDPGRHRSGHLHVETSDSVTYCGAVLNAHEGAVAVRTATEGRVEVPTAEVATVAIVESCEEDGEP